MEIEEKKKGTQLKKRKREEEKKQQKKGKHKLHPNAHCRIRESSSGSHIPDDRLSARSTSIDSYSDPIPMKENRTGEVTGPNTIIVPNAIPSVLHSSRHDSKKTLTQYFGSTVTRVVCEGAQLLGISEKCYYSQELCVKIVQPSR